MELKEQRYVVTLADTGNLTKAAKKLSISQPALSLYIKNLENSYGEQLFSRQNRRLKPTYFGELYIEKARQIIRIGNDFKEEMDFMRNGARGKITFGIPQWRSPIILPVLLPAFREKYPDIELNIVEEDSEDTLITHLDKNKIDFAITSGEYEDHPYIKIGDDKVLLCASENNPICSGPEPEAGKYRTIKPDALAHQIFLFKSDDADAKQMSDNVKKVFRLGSSQFMTLKNSEAAFLLVKQNFGVTLIPESRTKNMDLTGLCLCEISGNHFSKEMGILKSKDNKHSEFVDILIQMIDELFSTDWSGNR